MQWDDGMMDERKNRRKKQKTKRHCVGNDDEKTISLPTLGDRRDDCRLLWMDTNYILPTSEKFLESIINFFFLFFPLYLFFFHSFLHFPVRMCEKGKKKKEKKKGKKKLMNSRISRFPP